VILSWREFTTKVRRKETPLYSNLYDIAKVIQGVSFPMISPLHRFLYHEWNLRTTMWHNFWRIVYYEPIFKSQCVRVGSGFKMYYAGNGSAKILGDLQIHFGTNVTIFDNASFVGLKVFNKPELHVGSNTYIGPNVSFRVGKNIKIGEYCFISSNFISDNPGHSLDDALDRMQSGGGSPRPDTIRSIEIGDLCWLTLGTAVYPGTTVGDGVVAKLGTHLSKTVPPFCLVSGSPWKVEKKLPIPEELKEHFGEDRYRMWKEQQAAVVV